MKEIYPEQMQMKYSDEYKSILTMYDGKELSQMTFYHIFPGLDLIYNKFNTNISPTSRNDIEREAENETEIQEAISKLVKNKTVLIIAHRMRTVTNADKIVLLKDSVVKEQGNPKELLEKDSIFKDMVQKQQESLEWNLN